MMKKLLCSITLLVLCVGFAQAQDINVTGLGNIIPGDGSNVPAITDDTDFGSQDITSGSVTHTFTVNNTTGSDLLLLGDNPITGADATEFSKTDILNRF